MFNFKLGPVLTLKPQILDQFLTLQHIYIYIYNRGKPFKRDRECLKTPVFSNILVPSSHADPNHPLKFLKTPLSEKRRFDTPFVTPWHVRHNFSQSEERKKGSLRKGSLHEFLKALDSLESLECGRIPLCFRRYL